MMEGRNVFLSHFPLVMGGFYWYVYLGWVIFLANIPKYNFVPWKCVMGCEICELCNSTAFPGFERYFKIQDGASGKHFISSCVNY